jgi:hypothetical protein
MTRDKTLQDLYSQQERKAFDWAMYRLTSAEERRIQAEHSLQMCQRPNYEADWEYLQAVKDRERMTNETDY